MVLGTDTYSSSRLLLYKSIIFRNRTGANLHVISSHYTNMLVWLEIYASYRHNNHYNGVTFICYTTQIESQHNRANKAPTALICNIILSGHINVFPWSTIYASFHNNKNHNVQNNNCYSIQIGPCQNNYANKTSAILICIALPHRSFIYAFNLYISASFFLLQSPPPPPQDSSTSEISQFPQNIPTLSNRPRIKYSLHAPKNLQNSGISALNPLPATC